MINYYGILGLPRNANTEEIKSAYERLLKHHSFHKKTARECELIEEAFRILSNPESRKSLNEDVTSF